MAEGEVISEESQMMLRARYGVDQPVQVQYLKWLRNILRGDLGVSWAWNKPIGTLIAERLPWSLLISSISLLFVYAVAIPVGVLAATHQYSLPHPSDDGLFALDLEPESTGCFVPMSRHLN